LNISERRVWELKNNSLSIKIACFQFQKKRFYKKEEEKIGLFFVLYKKDFS
jgi:hypothetical protein